jgi:hypothetical protein
MGNHPKPAVGRLKTPGDTGRTFYPTLASRHLPASMHQATSFNIPISAPPARCSNTTAPAFVIAFAQNPERQRRTAAAVARLATTRVQLVAADAFGQERRRGRERGPNPSQAKNLSSDEGDYVPASSAKSHSGKVSAARTARSGRMMSVRISGRPISGQAQTSVSSPSTGSGVSQ